MRGEEFLGFPFECQYHPAYLLGKTWFQVTPYKGSGYVQQMLPLTVGSFYSNISTAELVFTINSIHNMTKHAAQLDTTRSVPSTCLREVELMEFGRKCHISNVPSPQ